MERDFLTIRLTPEEINLLKSGLRARKKRRIQQLKRNNAQSREFVENDNQCINQIDKLYSKLECII